MEASRRATGSSSCASCIRAAKALYHALVLRQGDGYPVDSRVQASLFLDVRSYGVVLY